MNESVNRVAREELRDIIERYERLDAKKHEIMEDQKYILKDAESKGYDKKALKKIIAMRKRDPMDLAEEEAILNIYKEALGLTASS